MPYESIEKLPALIRDRLDAVGFVDANIALADSFGLNFDQQQALLSVENEILTKQQVPSALTGLLASRLGTDAATAKKIAVEVWGNYFLLLQDFLGRVDELLASAGAGLPIFQDRARRLLSPHLQLQDFLREYLADTPLENAGDAVRAQLIDAILDRTLEKIYAQQFSDRVTGILLQAGFPPDSGRYVVDSIEGRVANKDLTRQWAEYYVNLPETVLSGIAGHFEESTDLLEQDETPAPAPSLLYLLQEFEHLPEEVKRHLTSQEVRSMRADIEAKYGVALEHLILRAAVRDFSLADLPIMIKKECRVSPEVASAIKEEVMRVVFEPILSHYTAMNVHSAGENQDAIQDSRFKIQEKGEAGSRKQEAGGTQTSPAITATPMIDWRKLITPVVLPTGPVVFPTTGEYASLVDELLEKSQLPPLEHSLQNRLRQILLTRIKNIRTVVETKEKLIGSVAMGGVGLSDDIADRLMYESNSLADMIASGQYREDSRFKIQDSGRDTIAPKQREKEQEAVPLQESEFVPPLDELMYEEVVEGAPEKQPTATPEEPEQEEQEKEPPILTIEEVDGLPTLVERNQGVKIHDSRFKIQGGVQPSQSVIRRDSSAQGLGMTIPEKPATPNPKPITDNLSPITFVSAPPPALQPPAQVNQPEKQEDKVVIATKPASHPALADAKPIPVIIRATNAQPAKVAISDVRPSPRLVDTAEELRIMTLKDFRRLSADPMEAIKKINVKIQLLEKESITKKIAAIEAWKESAVSKLYREMGEECFGRGVAIDQVISQRTAEGKEALTEAEFDALLELNELLRV